jgi:hypothetical protein
MELIRFVDRNLKQCNTLKEQSCLDHPKLNNLKHLMIQSVSLCINSSLWHAAVMLLRNLDGVQL